MNTILEDIIDHHIWANDTLLTFCETLTPGQLALTMPGTFGGIEATLVHLAANEEGYLEALDNAGVHTGVRTTILSGEAPRTLASVRPVLAKTAEGWRRIARDWPQNAVKDFPRDGTTAQLPISVLVTQGIDHGVEHRTHIRTILAAHGIARDVDEGTTEPNIDAWAWYEQQQSARAGE